MMQDQRNPPVEGTLPPEAEFLDSSATEDEDPDMTEAMHRARKENLGLFNEKDDEIDELLSKRTRSSADITFQYNMLAIGLYVTRTAHIVCSMISFSCAVLDYYFDFTSYDQIKESSGFKRLMAWSGIGMILTGVVMATIMKN